MRFIVITSNVGTEMKNMHEKILHSQKIQFKSLWFYTEWNMACKLFRIPCVSKNYIDFKFFKGFMKLLNKF